MSSLPYPKIKFPLHRIFERPHRKNLPSKILLSGQDQTRATSDLCAWPALERYGRGNHSQRAIPGSDAGKNTLGLWERPHNLSQNSFCERLSPFGFKLYPILVVDLLHEFELGVLKSVLKHLLRIINAVDPREIDILNERCARHLLGNVVTDKCSDRFTRISSFGLNAIRCFPPDVADTSQRPAWFFEHVLQV